MFIRDVDSGEPIDDPTGWKRIGASGIRDLMPIKEDTPRPKRTLSDLLGGNGSKSATSRSGNRSGRTSPASGDYFTSSPLSAEPEQIHTTPTPTSASSSISALINANHEVLKVPSVPSSAPAGARSGSIPEYEVRSPSDRPEVRPKSSASLASFSSSMNSQMARLSEAEKKRYALQARVCVARTQMSGHVPLRIFRDPQECVEVEQILDKDRKKV